jgi:CBS domain-containing protein
MKSAVRELMSEELVQLDADRSVAEAARLMRDHDVGSVVVTQKGKLVGIVTDRDLVVRGLADGSDLGASRVGAICTERVTTLAPDDDAERAVRVMEENGIRRIPVVDGDQVLGILSLGDLAIDRDGRSVLGRISAASPNN